MPVANETAARTRAITADAASITAENVLRGYPTPSVVLLLWLAMQDLPHPELQAQALTWRS
jgi:hypothetical protein